MPTPQKGQSKADFNKICIPQLVSEGMTQDEAVAQCSVIFNEANKTELKMETAELLNVEVLKQGVFTDMHGRRVVVDDDVMTELKDNFDAGVGEPVLTINHSGKQTKDMNSFMKSINLGIISKLKKAGESMFADFKKVPVKVAEMIKSGRLIFRSAEWKPVFHTGDAGLKSNVLTGVTFHGGADGKSAISGLSNDFEAIGLKLFSTEQKNNEDEIISIDFKNHTGGGNMAKIEIEKNEYDALKKSDDSIKDVQNENIKLKAKVDENDKIADEKKTADEENIELKKYKEDREKDDVVNLKTEADEFADKLIKDEKLQPSDKDDIVDDYIRLKTGDDEDKFNRFVKRYNEADKVVDLSQITKDASGNEVPTTEVALKSNDGEAGSELDDLGKSTDKIQEQIQLKMKQDGISWEDAANKLGVFKESDFNVKLNNGGK